MTTRLIASLVTSVLATSLVLTSSAQAGGCGGGYKAYRSSSKAGAYSKKKTIVSTERRAGKPVVDKSVESEKTTAAEELANPVDKAAEAPDSETGARTTSAAGNKDCKRFVAAIGSTVSVECAK